MADLKPGWKRVKFGEVVRQVKTKVNPETSGLERYIAGEHMDTDDLRIRRWGDVGDGYLGPAFHMHFKPGQVLYGSRRTYLRKVAVADFEGICANTTFVLESADSSKLLPELLPFIMQTEAFREHSKRESKGSVNPYVNFSDLAWYEFTLPPLEEQRRLVTPLHDMRRLLEGTRELVEQAHSLRRSWLRAEAEQLMKATSQTVPLGELLEGSPNSGCSAPERDIETGYWVLGLSSLSDSGYVPSEYKAVDRTQAMLAARLQDGDLLITRSNTRERVGFVGRFLDDGREVSFPDTMMRLRPKLTRVLAEWLELILQSSPIRGAIQATAAGTSASMKKINRQNLLAVRVPHVSLPAQQRQVDAFSLLRVAERDAEARLAMAYQVQRKLLERVLNP
jgi:type I restriction enzyme S subunit